MRHAKSDWEDMNLSDFDRPLNQRGKKAAPMMGKELKDRKILPDIIFSSPAKRAKSTAIAVAKELNYTKEIFYIDDFYFGNNNIIIQTIKNLNASVNSVMLVGHNPTWQNLITQFSKEVIHEQMTTGNVACLEADIEKWSDFKIGTCNYLWILRPKELF